MIVGLNCFSQKINYIDYHKDINKAEELFFMENKTDSALYYYDKVFAKYDFIFVKDLANAAQIAFFTKKPYLKYIEQGFEQGLKTDHLKRYSLFKFIYPKLLEDKKLLKIYQIKRKKYISRIDFKYLDFIYKIAIKDQKDKCNDASYKGVVYITTERIRDSILQKGFPGDRIIGIADSTVFKEVGKPHLDLYNQRKNDKKLWYMTSDEEYLSSEWPLVMLVHNRCSYFLYKDVLLEEMKKGNIHPRDIGLLYDNVYRFKNYLPSYCNNILLKGAYHLNSFTNYSELTDRNETNAMRKKLYIVSTEVDDKKKEYEIKYGFKLFTGFWFCR